MVGRIEASGPARPVKAWNVFCDRYAGECDVNTSEPASVSLNAKLWRTLNAVNQKVNSTIKPTTDQDHWGLVDRWDMPTDGTRRLRGLSSSSSARCWSSNTACRSAPCA